MHASKNFASNLSEFYSLISCIHKLILSLYLTFPFTYGGHPYDVLSFQPYIYIQTSKYSWVHRVPSFFVEIFTISYDLSTICISLKCQHGKDMKKIAWKCLVVGWNIADGCLFFCYCCYSFHLLYCSNFATIIYVIFVACYLPLASQGVQQIIVICIK